MPIEITSSASGGMSWDHEAVAGDTVLVVFAWMDGLYDEEIGLTPFVDHASYGAQAFDLSTFFGSKVAAQNNSLGDGTHKRILQVMWMTNPELGTHAITLVSDHGMSGNGASYMLTGTNGPPTFSLQNNATGGNQHFQFLGSDPPATTDTGYMGSNGGAPGTDNFILAAEWSTVGASLSAVPGQELVEMHGDVIIAKKYPTDPVFSFVFGYVDHVLFDIADGDVAEDFFVGAGVILGPPPVEPPPETPQRRARPKAVFVGI